MTGRQIAVNNAIKLSGDFLLLCMILLQTKEKRSTNATRSKKKNSIRKLHLEKGLLQKLKTQAVKFDYGKVLNVISHYQSKLKSNQHIAY